MIFLLKEHGQSVGIKSSKDIKCQQISFEVDAVCAWCVTNLEYVVLSPDGKDGKGEIPFNVHGQKNIASSGEIV